MAPSKKVTRVSLQKTVDSVVIHDMKNLAFRLSALLQNMENNYDNPVFKQSVSEILTDTIQKMETIVKRFRDQQQQIVVKLRCDVNHILKELIEELPQKRIRNMQLNLQLNEVPLIWGDPFYLHNAFHSLIENGLDAMPEGGSLGIKTAVVRRHRKNRISVEISDTGVGMTQAFVENQLFNPFNTTKAQGLGLGLFTSQQIFSLHRGRIEVLTAPGSGTTFRVLIPVEEDGKNEVSHH